MPFLTKVQGVFRNKESTARKHARENGFSDPEPPKPRWDDAWQRQEVEPEEVQELLRGCTAEIKSRGLDLPFLLLPFRPASDPSAARTFVRNYFGNGLETYKRLHGDHLIQELRLVEPLVLCSVVKWCWSRLTGGVVTWEAYELFKIGEQDSSQARDAFATFIPISVASDARTKIIFDFFELLAGIAAHGKSNGLGGLKLSRFAGWWAFEHVDTGKGFDAGYKTWESAADATSHLFFAYLRSLSPESVQGKNGVSTLPLSLQNLLQSTDYPPVSMKQRRTSKVAMIVDTVSPTPFALLRRAKNFEYRDDDAVLQRFSDYDDPVKALTEECRRVLKSISSTNDSSTSKASTSLKDPSWSRFEDIGFGEMGDESEDDGLNVSLLTTPRPTGLAFGTVRSKQDDGGRPTTPSWADFLSSGFVDDSKPGGPTLLLPPDKVLPPINTRGQSSQSQRKLAEDEAVLEPGELANITLFNLDETFWWVWITSLAGEETLYRKAVFGRCALIETRIENGTWIVVEEVIKGAAAEPDVNIYVAEKKSIFGFSKRTRLSRSKSSAKNSVARSDMSGRINNLSQQPSKTSIAPDQHARIQAAAAALQQKHQKEDGGASSHRTGKHEEVGIRTNNSLTLQPFIESEAAPAMKWANSYDKNTIRSRYLEDSQAGKGSTTNPPNNIVRVQKDKHVLASGSTAEKSSDFDIVPLQNISPPTLNGSVREVMPESLEVSSARSDPKAMNSGASANSLEVQDIPPQLPAKDIPSTGPIPNGVSSVSPTSADKLRLKKAPSNAFKGMFNRRKEDQVKLPLKPIHASSSAVAAAKAALEAKAAQNQGSPPPATKVTNKRYSTPGKGVVEEPFVNSSTNLMHADRPMSTVETIDYTESHASTVDPREAEQAENEFSSFDQGPLEDQPAFVSENLSRTSIVASEDTKTPKVGIEWNKVDETKESSKQKHDNNPNSSDRWAQIRKNAAERAARMSEDQSRQTDRTEDGETGGEETIESRVARIKARVAELTGNMEDSGVTRPHS